MGAESEGVGFDEMSQELAPELQALVEEHAADFSRIEALASEEEKLLEKDKRLIRLIVRYLRALLVDVRAGDLTRAEIELFFLNYLALDTIERVLWELKHLKGNPPGLPAPPKLPDGPDKPEEEHPERITD